MLFRSADLHDIIVEIGGFSAGLDFDSAGNLYYGSTFVPGGDGLYRFDGTDLDTAIGTGNLLAGDGTLLSGLPGGAYDTEVDDADNVLLSYNVYPAGFLAMWDGTAGGGVNLTTLGTDTGGFPFFTLISADGDLTDPSGAAYVVDPYNHPGIAEVMVPEPATLLFGAAGMGWMILRRRPRIGAVTA